MAYHSNRRTFAYHRRRKKRSRRRTFKALRRFARWRWREFRTFLHALSASPPAIRYTVGAALILVCWLTVNWIYQTINKPTEVFFPVENAFDKSISETWREYGSLFREHATATIAPELLAALAQVESTGNPVARTYWRWRPSWNPLEWYQPASSAVGMFQITDGTFHEAKRYCIHDHKVVEDGPWHDVRSCWFNNLYTRVVPSHAIEMTSALLDRAVANALRYRRIVPATPQRKQDLAAVIHLCGAGAGQTYAARGFRLSLHQRCGDHDVRAYLIRVNATKQQFASLASSG